MSVLWSLDLTNGFIFIPFHCYHLHHHIILSSVWEQASVSSLVVPARKAFLCTLNLISFRHLCIFISNNTGKTVEWSLVMISFLDSTLWFDSTLSLVWRHPSLVISYWKYGRKLWNTKWTHPINDIPTKSIIVAYKNTIFHSVVQDTILKIVSYLKDTR
jgi:hypothetical protein